MNNTWKERRWMATGLILLVTLITYLPVLRGGFIWDDNQLITDNRMVQARDGLYRFWFTTEAPDYYPLTSSFWWLQWRLWGRNAEGWHAVNVLLHAANVVLIWMVLRRLRIPGAWLAALLFAVHPVNVATVAWISEQKNTLSMFFSALTILLYLRFEEESRWRWYGLALAAFLLALLSKTAVVMLPVVLLGCVWWQRGRMQLKDLLCSVPFFALSLVSGLATIWFHYEHVLRVAPVRVAGFMTRLAIVGWGPWFYLYKALLPVNLMMIYPLWKIDTSRLISYVPGVILIGGLTLFWWKRKTWGRALFFGLGYFVVMLFPVLGFFDQSFYRFSLVADHWQYYSIVGVTALVAAGAVALGPRFHRGQQQVIHLVAGVVVIALVALSWQRCLVFRNQETLFRDNLLRNPLAWVAHNNLGFALKKAGRTQEAVGHYEQALQINPDFAAAHYNLGVALQQTGRLPEAIGHYEQALRINPGDAAAHNNLAIALQQTGRLREAIGHYEQALRIDPDDATAYNNLAGLLATLAPMDGGDPVRAVPLAQRACELTGNQAAVYLDTLAIAYAAAGRFNDAIATAQKAIDLARSAGQAQLVREIEMRLELYRVGRAHL